MTCFSHRPGHVSCGRRLPANPSVASLEGGSCLAFSPPHPHADSGCLQPTRPVCASSRRVSATPPYLGTPTKPPAISFQRTHFVPLPRGSLAPPPYRGTPTNTLADSKTYCISTDRGLCYDSLHWHACFTSRRLLSAHPVGASLKRIHVPHSYHGTPTRPPVVSY